MNSEAEDFAMAAGIILTDGRARQQLEWLLKTSGPDAVAQAIGGLIGRRRPYPLNLAHVLGVRLPAFHVDCEDEDDSAVPSSAPVAVACQIQNMSLEDVLELSRQLSAENSAAAARHEEYLRLQHEALMASLDAKLDAFRVRHGLPPRQRPT